ncbi:TPA: hypothetical protein DEP94_01450 [Candidatus Nomurabacteria bacterium]|nr:hypothetical protein [Candidatus Nomurabacteria bacterium]
MKIAQYIISLALEALNQGRPLPASLGETEFFVAEAGDENIIAHDAITHDGKEYKIGTHKNA